MKYRIINYYSGKVIASSFISEDKAKDYREALHKNAGDIHCWLMLIENYDPIKRKTKKS